MAAFSKKATLYLAIVFYSSCKVVLLTLTKQQCENDILSGHFPESPKHPYLLATHSAVVLIAVHCNVDECDKRKSYQDAFFWGHLHDVFFSRCPHQIEREKPLSEPHKAKSSRFELLRAVNGLHLNCA